MKTIVFLLLSAAIAFGTDGDGCNESSGAVITSEYPGEATITLTVVNTWSVTWASKALGLDCFEDGGTVYVLGTSNSDMMVASFDPATGTPGATMPLAAANGSCFGVAWNNDPDTDTYYTDDWSDNVLYYTENFGSIWSTIPNPAGNSGRGMDFDGADYWITNGTGTVYRFSPGVGQDLLSVPEAPSQLSGITVFPFQGDVGVAVTTYNTLNIYFYQWDGSTLTYLGYAACPASCTTSYGLAYSEVRDTIFWSYNSGGYTLSEVEFVIDVALERATWAEIKTSF